MRSFKSNNNIHKKEGGSYYVVSANKASSVTLQSPGNKSQKKYTAILRISYGLVVKPIRNTVFNFNKLVSDLDIHANTPES